MLTYQQKENRLFRIYFIYKGSFSERKTMLRTHLFYKRWNRCLNDLCDPPSKCAINFMLYAQSLNVIDHHWCYLLVLLMLQLFCDTRCEDTRMMWWPNHSWILTSDSCKCQFFLKNIVVKSRVIQFILSHFYCRKVAFILWMVFIPI